VTKIANATSTLDKPATGAQRGIPRRLRKVKIVPVVLVVLTVISAGLAAWLYFYQYRPDQQTGPSVAQAALGAASDGTVALLSYSPESLDRDFATAKSHLAGDFLSYYDQFTQQIVAPAAKQ
jgi:Mce-associated membrane protein